MWNDYEDHEDEDTQQTSKYRRGTFSSSCEEEDDF
jgi:hypothetical protein